MRVRASLRVRLRVCWRVRLRVCLRARLLPHCIIRLRFRDKLESLGGGVCDRGARVSVMRERIRVIRGRLAHDCVRLRNATSIWMLLPGGSNPEASEWTLMRKRW